MGSLNLPKGYLRCNLNKIITLNFFSFSLRVFPNASPSALFLFFCSVE